MQYEESWWYCSLLDAGSSARSWPLFYAMPPFPRSIAEDVKALGTEQPVIAFRLRRRIINHLFEELKSYDWYV